MLSNSRHRPSHQRCVNTTNNVQNIPGKDQQYLIKFFNFPLSTEKPEWNTLVKKISNINEYTQSQISRTMLPLSKMSLKSIIPMYRSTDRNYINYQVDMPTILSDGITVGKLRTRKSVDLITTKTIRLNIGSEHFTSFHHNPIDKYLSRCDNSIFISDIHAYNKIKENTQTALKLRLSLRSFSSDSRFSSTSQ